MFKENMRLELTYVKNLKTLSETLKAYKNGQNNSAILELFDACITSAKAIILLYKNLGEAWNELTAYIMGEKAKIEGLKAEFEAFKGEINEKVDDVNNYLNNVIREVEARVEAIERELEAMDKVKIYIMRFENNQRIIYNGNERATASEMVERLNNGYNVFVYYVGSSDVTIFNVYSTTSTTLYFICSRMYANKELGFRCFTFSGNTVSQYVTQVFNPENFSNSITNLNSRMGDAEIEINGVGNTIEEAKPYQFTITLPTSGWSTYGSMFFYHAPQTFDLTKDAMVTLSAGGSLPYYDDIFDNMERARAIGLFGCFDDNGGVESASCLQFYANSVPTDPLKVLVTISPFISNSAAVSTVVNGIY